MKASGSPAMGAVVKSIRRLSPRAMEQTLELNPMTKFWHEELTRQEVGKVTEATWYPEMGLLGAPSLTSSVLVRRLIPVSLSEV
jgi:hypothetical protein